MKFKFFFGFVFAVLFLLVLATAVMAQGEPPPPYAGLKSPFPWDDASAQEVGKGLYQQSCLGCHGANGSNIAGANFSTTDFLQSLEESPGFYFWVISEGRLDKGMPPFKSSFSEEQRWQLLTYLRSLGAVASPEVTLPPTQLPAAGEGGTLRLTAPEPAQSGQVVTISAVLQNKEGKPIESATIKFYIKVDFFTIGLVEIGEAVTDGQGVAVFEYTPRQTGETQIVARYQTIETASKLSLIGTDKPFYQAKAGLPDSTTIPEIFVGPKSALEPGEAVTAPITVLRIPGGLPSLLLLAYVFTVILVWSLYLRVMYQLFRIPVVKKMGDTNVRLVPSIGLVVMFAFVVLLVLVLITGPYSNPHLLR